MTSSIPPRDGHPTAAPRAATWSWPSLFVLAGLWAFAVTQPLLSILGEEPSFFLMRRTSEAALILFALALALVPPVLLWALGFAAERIDERVARWYQRAVLAAIVAVAAAPILADLGVTEAALVGVLAVAAGVGFAMAYERFSLVALWARFTAVLPVISVAAFLVASPTSALLQSSVREHDDVEHRAERPPVVFLLLDELPTQSLLDDDGAIDAGRFPNLAALAEDGTWYRNHTAAATTTAQAVPAILTGNGPLEGAPMAATYPDNLFTLLAPTHQLQVSESLTAMCPRRLCQDDSPTPALLDQVGSLSAEATGLLVDRVRPDRTAQPAMDDFAETLETIAPEQLFGQLVSAPVRFTEFVDGLAAGRPRAAGSPVAIEADVAIDEDVVAVEGDDLATVDGDGVPMIDGDGAVDGDGAGPPDGGRSAEGVDGSSDRVDIDEPIAATDDRPTLSFLHLLLPHGPYRLYPDGQAYATTSYPVGDYDDSTGEPWIKALRQQRHLLQASYADLLVGQVTETLRQAGTYDETLLVLVADHGVAFRHGADSRTWHDETVSDIAYSPLIIKAPGQAEGGPDDRNVSSLDILPTIADLVDVRVPWSTEGDPVDSAAVSERDDRKSIVDRGPWSEPTARHVHEFSLTETAPSAAKRLIPSTASVAGTGSGSRVASGALDGLLAPLGVLDWLGLPLDELGSPDDRDDGADHEGDEPAAVSTGVARLVPPSPAAEPEGLVRGTVEGAEPGSVVLVAVGGTVVTAAPIIVLEDEAGTFLALLPPEALLLAVDRSTVSLALVSDLGTDRPTVTRLAVS